MSFEAALNPNSPAFPFWLISIERFRVDDFQPFSCDKAQRMMVNSNECGRSMLGSSNVKFDPGFGRRDGRRDAWFLMVEVDLEFSDGCGNLWELVGRTFSFVCFQNFGVADH